MAVPVGSGSGSVEAAATGQIAIFYYPWYSTPRRDGGWAHWYVQHDGAPILSTRYFPARGLYSSSNLKVVDAQMREIRTAGVDTVVVSWWGFGSPEADRLPLVLDAAKRNGLDVAIHLEPYPGRTPASTTLVGRAKAAGFDGLYTYDVGTWNGSTFARICTEAHAAGLLCAPSVGPGYDARLATGDQLVRRRRGGTWYDRMWRAALRARADLVTITSYNEWQEGTQIEPARAELGRPAYDGAWGREGAGAERAYLDATTRWTARARTGLPQ